MIDGSDAAAAGSKPSGQQLGFLLFLYSSFPFFSHPSLLSFVHFYHFFTVVFSVRLCSLALLICIFMFSEPAPHLRSALLLHL